MQRGPVLVTGASGFVGRWVVAELTARGIEAAGLGRPRNGAGGPVVECDLADGAQLARALEQIKPHTIVHLAWTTEHGRFWSAPDNLDWIGATLNLARCAVAHGVQRFVGVGTCFEYLWPSDGACYEAATPLRPATLYGISKDATRRVLEAFWPASFAWARLFYLYGPLEDPRRLVASVASRLVSGQAAPLSSGLAIRDFMDVRDAGAALAALALSDVEGPVNIASGTGNSVREIAEKLGQLSGTPHLVTLGALPDRDEPPRIIADVRRLREEVGYTSGRDLDTGLAECYAWWRNRAGGDQHEIAPTQPAA